MGCGDELLGEGNAYSAEFCMCDARLTACLIEDFPCLLWQMKKSAVGSELW